MEVISWSVDSEVHGHVGGTESTVYIIEVWLNNKHLSVYSEDMIHHSIRLC